MAGPSRSTIEAIEKEEEKRRKAIREELEQKLELEEKSHTIVERLLECQIEEEFLINCAKFILPDHYKDVVEERAITKQCGYPMCDNVLGQTPKKQYHISMKTNKVYDITDRKCFCSNDCYKASQYYASQISTVPLWMRDKDEPVPIRLLKPNDSVMTSMLKQSGSGDEVILKKQVSPNYDNLSDENESKSSDKAVDQLTDDIMSIKFFQDENKDLEPLVAEDVDDEPIIEVAAVESKTPKIKNIERSSTKHKKDLDIKRKPKLTLDILKLVTDSLWQWRTKGTIEYLSKNCHDDQDANNSGNLSANAAADSKPIICEESLNKPVTAMDNENKSEEEGGDKTVGSLSERKMRAMEEEAYRIQVESLYYGKTQTQVKRKNKKDIKENVSDEKTIAMPYVDSQSQMAIRRKIILDRLNKVFSEFLGPLRLSIREFSSDLNALVHTFHLGSKNMSFKPIGWTLLAVVLLKMLVDKNEFVSAAMRSSSGVNFLSAMLKKVHIEYEKLDEFVQMYSSVEKDPLNL
ncbi:putative RNA polymerase II subunit B1 CTD phosphatase rpap2 [Antedon mediterranea]|uniref:putative RNA polymerase II subunit B1 CTD phosphatase rpap2 n=1 Tax=Antedon mediterranea TaxID=105859 RepID=UPI003AF4F10B